MIRELHNSMKYYHAYSLSFTPPSKLFVVLFFGLTPNLSPLSSQLLFEKLPFHLFRCRDDRLFVVFSIFISSHPGTSTSSFIAKQHSACSVLFMGTTITMVKHISYNSRPFSNQKLSQRCKAEVTVPFPLPPCEQYCV